MTPKLLHLLASIMLLAACGQHEHGSVEHIKDIHRSPSLIDVFVQIRLHSDNYIEQFNAPGAGKKLAVANISGLNSR